MPSFPDCAGDGRVKNNPIGNARSGLGNVLDIDLAFPLAGSEDIDSMQLLLQAQHSF